MTGWGSSWDKPVLDGAGNRINPTKEQLQLEQEMADKCWPVELKAPEVERIYNNVKPTHDQYSNPDALIYYECKCGAILDPGTKSFAALNNHASDKGWKVRWNKDGSGYQPFCVKCGEGVE